MKNIELVEQFLNNDNSNALIIGGECSGKSLALELIAKYLVKNTSVLVLSNNADIRDVINKYPESTFVYKGNRDSISPETITDSIERVVLIDECHDIHQLLQFNIDKRIIMTMDVSTIDEVPDSLKPYFKTIIECAMIDKQTHEKAIIKIHQI